MEDKELSKYEDLIAMIKKDGEKIEAPQTVLTSVLEKVTNKKDERFNLENQGVASPHSFISEYFNQIIFMSKQSYMVAAVVLAVVAAGGLYWYSQNPTVEPGVEYKPTQQKTSSAALATEVTSEVDAFDADLAAIDDFNSAQNEADLDALSKDLALLNNI